MGRDENGTFTIEVSTGVFGAVPKIGHDDTRLISLAFLARKRLVEGESF